MTSMAATTSFGLLSGGTRLDRTTEAKAVAPCFASVVSKSSQRQQQRRRGSYSYSYGRPRPFAAVRSSGRHQRRATVSSASSSEDIPEKIKLGVIGGSNLTDSQLFSHLQKRLVETRYGEVTLHDSAPDAEQEIAFVRRHYANADEGYVPPHAVNSKAILRGLKNAGCNRILLVCSVGSLNRENIPPHSIIMPNDYIALWNTATYAENSKIGELLPTFDSAGRAASLNALNFAGYAEKMNLVGGDAVYVQTRGPRFEAKAESRALRMMGGDVVGMTGISEVILANELRIPVTMLCFSDNYANGIAEEDDHDAYSQFYSNVQAQLDTVEGAVGTVMQALLGGGTRGVNGRRPETLLSR